MAQTAQLTSSDMKELLKVLNYRGIHNFNKLEQCKKRLNSEECNKKKSVISKEIVKLEIEIANYAMLSTKLGKLITEAILHEQINDLAEVSK